MAEKETGKPNKQRTKNPPRLTKVLHERFGVGIIEERIGHAWRVTFKGHGTMRIHRDYLTVI